MVSLEWKKGDHSIALSFAFVSPRCLAVSLLFSDVPSAPCSRDAAAQVIANGDRMRTRAAQVASLPDTELASSLKDLQKV